MRRNTKTILVKSRFFNDFIQKFSLYLISEVFWLPVGLTKLLLQQGEIRYRVI